MKFVIRFTRRLIFQYVDFYDTELKLKNNSLSIIVIKQGCSKVIFRYGKELRSPRWIGVMYNEFYTTRTNMSFFPDMPILLSNLQRQRSCLLIHVIIDVSCAFLMNMYISKLRGISNIARNLLVYVEENNILWNEIKLSFFLKYWTILNDESGS